MNYEKELTYAKNLARESGRIMRSYFGFDLKHEWKSDHTPLTEADTTINSLVIEKIKTDFPGDSVYGEEESFKTDSNRLWVCDPVDGTMPFSHGLQISTFSLALVVDGVPVVGVIYDPFMDRLFYATKNGGAFCNDKPIHVSKQPMQNSLINIEGFPADQSKAVSTFDKSICNLVESDGAKTTCLWSAIISFALIAAGQYSAAIFNLNYIHDVAAAKIIIDEAGGATTDLYGNEQRYDRPTQGFIASNGIFHDQLVDLFKK